MTNKLNKFHAKFDNLGAMPLSGDILTKANIGLWAFELDEGHAPRMYVDDTMLGLIGLTEQMSPEETYHAWYDRIDPDHYNEVSKSVEKMTVGIHAEVQYPWHHPNGEIWTVRCGGVRNYAYTKGIRIEGTHQNVTAIAHFEKQKIVELSTVIEALSEDFIFVSYIDPMTKEETIYRSNPELDELFPDWQNLKTYEERIEKLLCCFVHPDDRQEFAEKTALNSLKNDLSSDPVRYFNFRAKYNGKTVYYQAKYVLVEIDGRKHVVMGYRSVDEETRKQLAIHKELSEARLKAEAASKAKTAFLFNMSHDIRTPMNAIIGFTELAQNHLDDPEKVTNYLSKVHSSSKHMLNLINDVLDMARIESGKMKIEEKIINIREASTAAMEIAYENAKTRGVLLTLHSGPIGEEYIYADNLKLNQIALNIMSNAIKYTNPGGRVDVRVNEVFCDDPERLACNLIVEDTGIGMTSEFLAKIFEPFERSSTSTKSGVQGTGLGMAITKELVDRMGGKIFIESQLGVGTKVTILFNFRRAKKPVAAEMIEPEPCNLSTILKEKKVLLVEDNVLNREIAEEILTEEGMIVDSVEDGTIAVEKIKKAYANQYNLILMDVQMPIMDGYEATKRIRALDNKELANIPIIAMTANAFEEDKQNALAAGMNAHIAKPIDIKKLKLTLCQFLRFSKKGI